MQQHRWTIATLAAWIVLGLSFCAIRSWIVQWQINFADTVFFMIIFLPQLFAALLYRQPINNNEQKIVAQILWGLTLLTVPAKAILFADVSSNIYTLLLYLAPLPDIGGGVLFIRNRDRSRAIKLFSLALCDVLQTILLVAMQQ